jgi:hypothetical protein
VRKRHPVETALCEAFAKRAGIDLETFWRAMDGLPVPRWVAAGLAEAFAPRVTLGDFVIEGLTAQHEHNTIENVDATTSVLRSRGVRRAKGAPETKASRATEAAGLTYTEIASVLSKKLGRPFHVNSVQAWHKKKDDASYRRIPDDAATELQAMGIPRAVWPGIIPPKP